MEFLSFLFFIIMLVVSAKLSKKQSKRPAPKPPAPQNRPVQAVGSTAAEPPRPAFTPVAPEAEGEGSDVAGKGHVVEASFAPGAHAHEETSMTGFTECPAEESEPAPNVKSAPAVPAFSFKFTGEDAARAVIYAEILSKPKALR